MKVTKLFAALVLLSALSTNARADDTVIRFADLGVNSDNVYQYLALGKGVYRKFGIDLHRTSFLQGGPNLIAAAASGQVDLGDVGTPLLTGISRGFPLKIVGAPAMKREEFVLVGRRDIANLAALEGQMVGVSSIGGGQDQAIRKILSAKRLPPSGVTLIAYGSASSGYLALQSGKLAAVVLSEPEVTRSVLAGFGKILAKAVDYYGRYEQSYIFASDSFIAAHANSISAYFRANRAAIDYAETHPVELIDYGASKLNLPRNVAAKIFDDELATWSPSQTVDIQGMLNAVRTVQELGDIDDSWRPDVARMTDLRFNEQNGKDAANDR
jgi:NitT/TauT family transport system substrate-binding protein